MFISGKFYFQNVPGFLPSLMKIETLVKITHVSPIGDIFVWKTFQNIFICAPGEVWVSHNLTGSNELKCNINKPICKRMIEGNQKMIFMTTWKDKNVLQKIKKLNVPPLTPNCVGLQLQKKYLGPQESPSFITSSFRLIWCWITKFDRLKAVTSEERVKFPGL